MHKPALLVLIAAGVGLAVFGVVHSERPVQPTAVPAQQPTRVRVAGLMVNGPTALGDRDTPRRAFLGSLAGTRLALELAWPEGGLIDVRRADSVVRAFRDDRGTNLLARVEHGGPLELSAQVAADGRGAVFVLASELEPDPRATRLVAVGLVELTVGDEVGEHVSEPVEFLPGTIVHAGPFRLRVADVGPSDWTAGFQLELESKLDLTPVVRFVLIDDEGLEHALEPIESMSSAGVWRRTLLCAVEPVSGRLLVEAWSNPRIEAVPFEVSAGIGLR